MLCQVSLSWKEASSQPREIWEEVSDKLSSRMKETHEGNTLEWGEMEKNTGMKSEEFERNEDKTGRMK